MPAVSFQRLCDVLDAAGVEVGVARAPGGPHVLRLVDFGGCRSLALPVPGGFDAAVTMLCCSLALAADVPGFAGEALGPGGRLARARRAGPRCAVRTS